MAEMLRVLLLQLPVPNNPSANIPLAAGYLKAWAAHQGLLEQAVIDIMPRSIADSAGDALLIDAIAARRPQVLGLSLYTWNSERSLAIAWRVKKMLPELLVIVGGPEVQVDNDWLLSHPAVDIAVLGEGEHTFVELLQALVDHPRHHLPSRRSNGTRVGCSAEVGCLSHVPGLALKYEGRVTFTPPRANLEDLSAIPSPYLLGYLEVQPGDMALIECSRWCPYRCSFCLYGRNMSTKLGRRYFPAERVAAEVAWAKGRGAGAVHFVEANLNLLPYFQDLMGRLQALNADRSLRLYAELRAEHLSEATVDALCDAGLYAAEVGLQSANPEALAAVERRTNLQRWAVGARRLYERGIQVFLDVILGLPGDDQASILRTLDWIDEQGLGPYDIFTLQLLPGTGVRGDAACREMRYQEHPPYYVLETDRLSYSELRALRWELRERAGLDPQAVEGIPEPIFEARPLDLQPPDEGLHTDAWPVTLIEIDCAASRDWLAEGGRLARSVANHLTVVAHNPDAEVLRQLCWPIAYANPTIHWDVLLLGTLTAAELRALRETWPHQTGYLDRIAVYRLPLPEPAYTKVTPRLFVGAPLNATGRPDINHSQYPLHSCSRSTASLLNPLAYEGLAEVLWLIDTKEPASALHNIAVIGGNGVILAQPPRCPAEVEAWREETGWRVWEVCQVFDTVER